MTTNHVSVRLEPEVMARVDALGPIFSTKWRPATRSDILRGLILDGLGRLEAEARAEQGMRHEEILQLAYPYSQRVRAY